MERQRIIEGEGCCEKLDAYFASSFSKKLFLVCGNSIERLWIADYFKSLEERRGISVIKYDDFTPNPSYSAIVKGVNRFQEACCDSLVAVGGGSAIDVAKCIKMFAYMATDRNYLEQNIIPNKIPFLVVPTTAGSGSEATKYAVIYYKGEKQSVTSEGCIPQTVLMDASMLQTLPIYQKKATMMDAFCHALESFWSVNSTDESKMYSKKAIQLILGNWKLYLANNVQGNKCMLKAANMAGRAINITQTTAGHAMCYKLTGLYNIAHGHAAALCVAKLWPYMLKHMESCCDLRGKSYLEDIFRELAIVMGVNKAEAAADFFQQLLLELGLLPPDAKASDFAVLQSSVNFTRLRNNPIKLSKAAIQELYHMILQKGF